MLRYCIFNNDKKEADYYIIQTKLYDGFNEYRRSFYLKYWICIFILHF